MSLENTVIPSILTTRNLMRTSSFGLLSLFLATALGQSAAGQDLEQLDSYIAEAQQTWPVPGMAVAIVKDGEVVLAKGYGVLSLDDATPVDEHTLFAIASNSKAFTSAALAILVDEGKLAWDDRVVDYLPYLQLYDEYVTSDIRIHDLLSHRSGYGTYSGDLLWYLTDYSSEEVLSRIRYLRPTGDFRASYRYSNLMFIAAGEVIAAVSGQSWGEFVQERILDPLAMSRTLTSASQLTRTTNVAQPHGLVNGQTEQFKWRSWDAAGAAAGIVSSVQDMTEWLQLQLDRGVVENDTIFSPERSHEMWTPYNSFRVSSGSQARWPSVHFRGYGLGWSLMDYRGRKVASHGGAFDGMYSRVALVPEKNLGVVILTNSMTWISTALTYQILDAYLGGDGFDWSADYLPRFKKYRAEFEARQRYAEEHQVSGTTPSVPLEDYSGTYGGDLYGDATVVVAEGHLVLRFLPAAELVGDLRHLHHDTFIVEWRNRFPWFGPGTVQFILDVAGQPVEMKVDVPNEDFWFNELEFLRR
jgi:CubicO group peptidase (beta-lactamase class C family)